MPGEQLENLERVSDRISGAVLAYCRRVLATRQRPVFHMEELRAYVLKQNLGPVAPDSPGRILRQLRLEGKVDYKVISRSESVYLVIALPEPFQERLEFACEANA
jgi:hypothetical protein